MTTSWIIILFILSFFLVNNTVLAQNVVSLVSIESDLHKREKIYLHLDKSYYHVGEDIWFKIYLIDANTHKPGAISKIVYVDLINPLNEIVRSKIIKIIEGFGEGDFLLPSDFFNGEYTVRAYTNFMRNFDDSFFFRKKIIVNSSWPIEIQDQISAVQEFKKEHKKIPKVSSLDLQFFPEGGQIVNNILNRIGFKAVAKDGKGVELNGEIVDETNTKIAELKTAKFGMGLFSFIPRPNKKYKANIIYEGEQLSYNLPTSWSKGTVLQIVEHDELYKVYIQSSSLNGIDDFKFIGRQRMGIVFSSIIVGKKSKALITIPKNILDQGIVQFTLYDNTDKPLCERLVFYENKGLDLNVTISPSKKEYRKNELVELEISLDQKVQQAFKTNMSMVVIDTSVSHSDNYTDIRTYMLMNSEIEGEIENPGYYFYSDDPQRKKNLDILMMTQGWRQFVFSEPQSKKITNLNFFPEKGITLQGNVRNADDSTLPVRAEVTLAYRNKEEQGYDMVMTDNQGNFIFKDLNFIDSTSVMINAKSLNPKQPNIVKIDTLNHPEVVIDRSQHNLAFYKGFNDNSLKVNENEIVHADSIFMSKNNVIELDEVELEFKNPKVIKEDERIRRRILYKEPSHTLDFKDIQTSPDGNALTALKGRVPGIGGGTIILRGANSLTGNTDPLYLLDGMPVEDAAAISLIPVVNIDFVDVLVGTRAAIYGSRAGNGVIAVYTRRESNKTNKTKNKNNNGVVNFIHSGMSYSRKFYVPKFRTENTKRYEFKHPTTLYWNPNISLNEQNKANISFPSMDTSAKYKVVLEGLSSNGTPFSSETSFTVN